MPSDNKKPGPKATVQINGVWMSKLKHGRIMKFKAMLPKLDDRERLNADDIAARLGLTGSCIREWLRILGHRLKNRNNRKVAKHDHTGWNEKILPVYAANGHNAAKTAVDLDMDKSVVYRWLANNGHIVRKYRDRDILDYKFQNFR